MEVYCGVVSRQSPVCFSIGGGVSASSTKEVSGSASVCMGRRRKVGEVVMADQSHLQYYGVNSNLNRNRVVCGAMSSEKMVESKGLKKLKKKKKEQLKLLKGLSKDLSTFSQIGFGLDLSGDLADQVQRDTISEATEVLLKQLQKLKAEEKELKRRKKEGKANSKAIRMLNRPIGCEMSSSSSSESSSSDSECGEVVNMKSLKRAQASETATQSVVEVEVLSPPTTPVFPVLTSSEPVVSETEQVAVPATAPVSEEKIAVDSSCVRVSENSTSSRLDDVLTCSKKIEVCMGGKCKKSGAAELLDKFQQAVGIQGAVSSCKCMGKCKNAPAVKVVNEVGDTSVRSPSNALCIGVSLEDVDTIVANFLGESPNQFPLAA